MAKKKKEKYLSFTENGIRYLQCKKCGGYQSVSNKQVVSTICSDCINSMIPVEKSKSQYISTGRPAGWHWMKEFVDKEGNVFHKGKEIPELKGTLPVTKINPKKTARIKRRTKEQMLLDRYKKKKKALKLYKKKKEKDDSKK
jgi:hypothetical protein